MGRKYEVKVGDLNYFQFMNVMKKTNEIMDCIYEMEMYERFVVGVSLNIVKEVGNNNGLEFRNICCVLILSQLFNQIFNDWFRMECLKKYSV